jgi:hypothetical protein
MRSARAVVAVLFLALPAVAVAQGRVPEGQRTPGSAEAINVPADLPEAHLLRGEVAKLDHATGVVAVKTEKGTLDLWFPPTAVKDLKPGDRVEVQLGIRKTRAREATEAPAAPPKSP